MQFLEIFVTVTGLIYLVLEIRQGRWMWLMNIVSCASAAVMFGLKSIWANLGLNVLYCVMSVWGIILYSRDRQQAGNGDEIRLRRLPSGILWASASIALSGGCILVALLSKTGDPAPVFDGIIGILGITGTWWLAKSYAENWIIWILTDALCTLMCLLQGVYWVALMYFVYTIASVYGYFNWKRKGQYLD